MVSDLVDRKWAAYGRGRPTSPPVPGAGGLVPALGRALSHAVRQVGATVVGSQTGERIRYELRLPTLPEARRLERESATG